MIQTIRLEEVIIFFYLSNRATSFVYLVSHSKFLYSSNGYVHCDEGLSMETRDKIYPEIPKEPWTTVKNNLFYIRYTVFIDFYFMYILLTTMIKYVVLTNFIYKPCSARVPDVSSQNFICMFDPYHWILVQMPYSITYLYYIFLLISYLSTFCFVC